MNVLGNIYVCVCLYICVWVVSVSVSKSWYLIVSLDIFLNCVDCDVIQSGLFGEVIGYFWGFLGFLYDSVWECIILQYDL